MQTRRVQNPKKIADVLYEWPLVSHALVVLVVEVGVLSPVPVVLHHGVALVEAAQGVRAHQSHDLAGVGEAEVGGKPLVGWAGGYSNWIHSHSCNKVLL